jgi:hypothetical protein
MGSELALGRRRSSYRGVEPVVVVGSDECFPKFRQSLIEPAAPWIAVAPIGVKDRAEIDREVVFALQTPGDRQFYTRVLLA